MKLRTTQDARRIQNRLFLLEEQRADLVTQRERLDVFIRRYVRGTPPGRQVTRCDYQPAPEDLADQIPTPEDIARQTRPPDESEQKWKYYRDTVVEACDVVRSAERRADPAEFLVKHPEFKELDDRVKQLEVKVRADIIEAGRLRERLAAATKALAEAEAKLAEATAQKQTEKSAAQIEQLRTEVAQSADTIDVIVKETQKLNETHKLPLAGVLAKQELLQTILANFRAVGGGDASGAHEVTKRLLTVLKTYPDVSGPLRAADKPPVNLLLLELAAQRLEYQRLDAEVRAERDRLKILQAQREAWIERARNWIKVVEAVETMPDPDPLRAKPIAVAHSEGNAEQKSSLTAVVNRYAETRVKYDGTVAGLAFDDDDRRRILRHDLSNVALTAWKDFIRAPLQEITAYHEGGLTSEDIANVIHALGLAGIAVGVNR